MNIGILGHVDHGKTTLTQMLTGKFTDEHSEELKRGISIRLGYADMHIRKCPKCDEPLCYSTFPKCFHCSTETAHQRTVSFIDCPGHETLMATVLTGASLMDGAILVIAANEPCPQPQTAEHLEVMNIGGIKNIVIVQNKIDIVTEEEALKNYTAIKAFVKGSVAENAPIIPVSAQHRANIEALISAIEKFIPTPEKDTKKDPLLYVARSFDVNKPGTSIPKLSGGVIGGSLVEGTLKVGETVEIVPGIKVGDKYKPIKTKIVSIMKGGVALDTGTPGGLLAIGTELDPAIAKSDNLIGNIAGIPGKLPPVRNTLNLETKMLERKIVENMPERIVEKDALLMNVGTARTVGVCT
ncbi:MAG: translation initiation factor IF-2 subunit gamma, partial [Candidatus Aenigmarchaeota archaeon]|nr:translation initiation factor IF-2 subunit gamma [Candidatus Aenigmarchaeota archaeon]